MDLSVIIVNYNVRYFLEQCLHSVYKALENIAGEVIVVDNDSVDGSCQMVREKFPQAILIDNKKNVGFSKANNQGIRIAQGKYVLILNPDTIVQETTFEKCFSFMETHPLAGSLGVKMIDGGGNFLPESKRALPTPAVAFFKIFGLSALFPKSKMFGRYHLGYLNNDEIHKVEVLPGAFMFMRKSVLDKIGLLDETFFMYGEDIDLSYRVILGGYENYYFPETTIIHYKGESTKKGSINYVLVFYKAMIIFANKHFSTKNARLYSILINSAVYLRASVSVFRRVVLTLFIPFADAALMFAGFYLIKPIWEQYKFGQIGYYPNEFLYFAVPSYIILWLTSVYMAGGYEKKTHPFGLLRGLLIGSIIVLVFYSLLPENYRYSRALILLGTLWAALVLIFNRLVFGSLFKNVQLNFGKKRKRIIIIGSRAEEERVLSIMNQVDIEPVLVGVVSWEGQNSLDNTIGDISQIEEITRINRIDEIVFCARDIPSQLIMQTMLQLGDTSVEFKIAPPESYSIIGSNSINTAGELYVVHFNALSQRVSRRKKRLFDFVISLLLLAGFPLLIFSMKAPIGFIRNILLVFFGSRTWVGFYQPDSNFADNLPPLPKGILSPLSFYENRNIDRKTITRVNLLYAKDYRVMTDLSIILRDFRNLGI